jgi:hypothetical protein
MKEKNKKDGLGRDCLPPYPEEQFSCSAEMRQTLIFWPLRLLVLRAVATLCHVRLCAVEDGQHGRSDLRREGVRWYSGRYPVAIEV